MTNIYVIQTLVLGAFLALALPIIIYILTRGVRLVRPGQALVLQCGPKARVSFSHRLVIPFLCKTELMDITLKRLELLLEGRESLQFKDGLRADLRVELFLGVNHTCEDVLKVAQHMGCEAAGDPERLRELFTHRVTGALKEVSREFTFPQALTKLERFRDSVIDALGHEHQGFAVYDLVITRFEATGRRFYNASSNEDAKALSTLDALAAKLGGTGMEAPF